MIQSERYNTDVGKQCLPYNFCNIKAHPKCKQNQTIRSRNVSLSQNHVTKQ